MKKPPASRARPSSKPRVGAGYIPGRRAELAAGSGASKPSIERMRALLERAEIRLNAGQLEQLWRFDQLLRRRNQDRDLTRLIEFEAVVVKHYVDSMFVGRLFELPSPLCDVGTGAGFPGIPLKIRYPHLTLVLAEQRPRRIAFLNEAIQSLGLARVETFKQRVVSRSFTTPMRGVITRAVEPIQKTLLRTSGCTQVGSQLIFMKGPNVDDELELATRACRDEYRLVFDRAYSLPHSTHARRLVVFERTAVREASAPAHEG